MAEIYKYKQAAAEHGFSNLFMARSILLAPATVFLPSYLIFYVLLYCQLARMSSRDPTSHFFDSTTAYDRHYSENRTAEARKYVGAAGHTTIPSFNTGKPPQLCIGIATVARRGEQYVDTTVGSLLTGLSDQDRSKIFLTLLFAHTDAAQHPSHGNDWVGILPDRNLHYPQDEATLTRLKSWESGGWYRNKSIYDYTYLLKDCFDTGAHYVAMIEDDTLAAEGWFRHTFEAINTIEAAMDERSQPSSWLYLRLFYADDLHRWNSEQWPIYLIWSLFVWTATAGILRAIRRRSDRARSILTAPLIATILCVCIPSGIALYFLTGKQTVAPLKPGVHEMNKYGCCSQGLVFPRAMIPPLLEKTDLTTDWLVDMMIETIADREKWTRWAVVPAMLQHIGATSSKGYGFDDAARGLWNFRFEDGPLD